jgi:hypothetical protein
MVSHKKAYKNPNLGYGSNHLAILNFCNRPLTIGLPFKVGFVAGDVRVKGGLKPKTSLKAFCLFLN